ncbi:hypothetical protein BVRB_9g216010 [Beta vulgaris subsp. vulgaris]|uniref:pentatricopeptide repeat-containing protein At4g38150 n=1 Tax=Beta vulgaris subsp. vulgaris TaxID=3555 RepID=UPI00053FBC52|nr:pentatricopeptide repeat-containing protein At4g38150 [Beta vulgaris subsp. vulgaris]KMT01606.1 hypothetical protein BVRB_9g216010 [Beta vulgaris subsp. vulgaris]
MRSLRGKSLDLAVISKFFNSLSYLSQPKCENGLIFPILLRFQYYSSVNGHSSGNGQFRKFGNHGFNGRKNDDFDDGDDSRFSGENRGNFSADKSFRSSRGERQMPQFHGKTDSSDRNYGRQGRNDGFRKPIGGYGNKGDVKLDDDFFKFDGKDEDSGGVGLGGDREGRKNTQPSVSELLNKPAKGEQSSGKKDGEFLEKFKLGGVSEEEKKSGEATSAPSPPQEEKMEVPENADEIFKKMKQTGLIPNAVAMLDGLCKDGLVQEAMKLFGLMREKGSMPEVVVYTAVVEGFCQAQSFDDAKRIFRKMQSNGIVPNAFSYTVLIKGLCKANKLDDAVEFCFEMLENGHSPNVVTFTGLVFEFCKEKGVEEAQIIIGRLKQKGFLLDEKAVRTYLDKSGPTSPMVWEAIFGPKKTSARLV